MGWKKKKRKVKILSGKVSKVSDAGLKYGTKEENCFWECTEYFSGFWPACLPTLWEVLTTKQGKLSPLLQGEPLQSQRGYSGMGLGFDTRARSCPYLLPAHSQRCPTTSFLLPQNVLLPPLPHPLHTSSDRCTRHTLVAQTYLLGGPPRLFHYVSVNVLYCTIVTMMGWCQGLASAQIWVRIMTHLRSYHEKKKIWWVIWEWRRETVSAHAAQVCVNMNVEHGSLESCDDLLAQLVGRSNNNHHQQLDNLGVWEKQDVNHCNSSTLLLPSVSARLSGNKWCLKNKISQVKRESGGKSFQGLQTHWREAFAVALKSI